MCLQQLASYAAHSPLVSPVAQAPSVAVVRPHLQPLLQEIKAERLERAQLGTRVPYQRTIP